LASLISLPHWPLRGSQRNICFYFGPMCNIDINSPKSFIKKMFLHECVDFIAPGPEKENNQCVATLLRNYVALYG